MRRIYPLDPASAQRLTNRRRTLGLTQNAIALATGLSESTIAKLETLRLPFSPEHRAVIDRTLDEAERGQNGGATL